MGVPPHRTPIYPRSTHKEGRPASLRGALVVVRGAVVRWCGVGGSGGVAAGGGPVGELVDGDGVGGVAVGVPGVGDAHGVAVGGVADDGQVVAALVGVDLAVFVGDDAGDVGHDGLAGVDGGDDVGLVLGDLLGAGLGAGDGDAVVAVGAEFAVEGGGDLVDAVGAVGGGAELLGDLVLGVGLALGGERDAGGRGAAVVAVLLQLEVHGEQLGRRRDLGGVGGAGGAGDGGEEAGGGQAEHGDVLAGEPAAGRHDWCSFRGDRTGASARGVSLVREAQPTGQSGHFLTCRPPLSVRVHFGHRARPTDYSE